MFSRSELLLSVPPIPSAHTCISQAQSVVSSTNIHASPLLISNPSNPVTLVSNRSISNFRMFTFTVISLPPGFRISIHSVIGRVEPMPPGTKIQKIWDLVFFKYIFKQFFAFSLYLFSTPSNIPRRIYQPYTSNPESAIGFFVWACIRSFAFTHTDFYALVRWFGAPSSRYLSLIFISLI